MNLRTLIFSAVTVIISSFSMAHAQETPVILFFGDSLTAGYGLSEDEAYPALIQHRLTAEGLKFRVQNSGLSGDTTAGGVSRLNWALRVKPAIFVLALGANDGLRGVVPAETKKNLLEIIKRVRASDPKIKILLCGIDLPTNLGTEFRKQFTSVFPEVAKESGVSFIPFLLEGVGGRPELNLPDGIHPTAEGQKIMADLVWRELKKLLENR